MTTPQVKPFESGGCVIHKIMLFPRGKASAWFNSTGAMVDVEYFPHKDLPHTRHVKPNGPLWREIEQAARSHLPK